ncbi:putative hydrolase of the HAD superfamily [Silvibacterium bohemicum]|uniref:Putative hydrolase of the HAD superfamily n=1 Tax=Silvibacterium bohemicum TaxID=1577686 RepID=A0A841K1A6_9BACT|nr:HAD family phosphatase [Silvibacterium bohemicum]MBB6146377.1 putative hydrolase of the HAD superfamily [Silvibacterium bohemicum]
MSDISTILWDVGGVLLTNGWDHKERAAVLARFNVDRDAFEQRHPEANDIWEKGLITVEEYLQRTVFFEPRDFTPSEFVAAMKAESLLLPDSAMGILENIATSAEVDLGMLNNEARELNDYRIEEFGLRGYFDFFFSSCYVGLRKPSPQIYSLALDVLQCEPNEVIFIDDRSGNAEVAASLGIHAIQYEGSEKLAETLAHLGIELENL